MRWIITSDHMSTSLAGVGEDAEGSIAYAGTNEGDSLPMEFRLYDARHKLCFEGRCGDIDADWWHGFEPLIWTWNAFRCRRLTYRRVDRSWKEQPFLPFSGRY